MSKFIFPLSKGFCFFLVLFLFSHSFAITETEVLEWFDDGLIETIEVYDFLELLENGNDEEAEALAFSLGLLEKEKMPKRTPKKFQGTFSARLSLDSIGNIISHKEELLLKYSAWNFRGDNFGRWLLAYQKDNYEALGGYLNDSDIKFLFPLQTIPGSWIAFHNSIFSLGGLLGTNQSYAGMLKLWKLRFWVLNMKSENTLAFDFSDKEFSFALLHTLEQEKNLFRMETNFNGGKFYKWNLRGLFFFHQDSSEQYWLDLPQSVKSSKLWTSQSQNINLKNVSFSLEERIRIPLDSGNVFYGLNFKVQKKKGFFRFLTALAYKNSSTKQNLFTLRTEPAFLFSDLLFFGKLQHNFYNEWQHIPKFSLGFKTENILFFHCKMEFIFPEYGASDKRPYQFRNEAGIKTEQIAINLKFHWKRKPKKEWSPNRFGIEGKIFF